ncbi:MAG: MOSC domain-containing protein [Thermaceae bacterium]|nr:MOSC domain-containing protein [Thermaceae bacterium]
MVLVSINIGSSQAVSNGIRATTTGINKKPVPRAEIYALGLNGDLVADKKNHGGPDQAVYVYSVDDYAWWAEQLGAELEPGTFGENLTFSSFGPETVRIGDRFGVGKVLLEVTAPRIPCWVLADRMGDNGFVKRFQKAERPGFYTRVIETGEVKTGDLIEKTSAPTTNPTLSEIFALWYEKSPSPETLRWVLSAPLAARARKDYEERLREITGIPSPKG